MDKDKGSSDTDERNDHGDTTTKDETEVKGTTTNSSGTSESTNSIQTEIRTSERNRKLTEKMAAYQETELEKRLAKLRSTYGKWQVHAKEIRTNLKTECSENDLGQMIDKIKALEASVLKNFNIVKDISTPAQDIVRRIDACVAVSADLLKILNERLSDIDTFDNVFEARRLSDLRRHAKSVFGESESSSSVSSSTSSRSRLSVKIAEAAADLEALRAAEHFNPIEERLQTDLKHLESKRRIEVAEARLKAYTKAIKEEPEIPVSEAPINSYSSLCTKPVISSPPSTPFLYTSPFSATLEPTINTEVSGNAPLTAGPYISSHRPSTYPYTSMFSTRSSVPVTSSTTVSVTRLSSNAPTFQPNITNILPQSNNDAKFLADTLANTVGLGRLPIPEPSIFTGDPIEYMEWKTAFEMLIDRKGIPPQEKIFYLKRYVSGPARQALEGFLYSGSEAAFVNARKVLDERYGNTFVLQQAFRKKLENWPKISNRDPTALRNFADFLQGCKEAMMHIPSLSILNDCSENQKLLGKLPEWASVRWNRVVTEALDSSNNYPSFSQFVEFVAREAKVACNPISSIHALNNTTETERKRSKEQKIRVLASTASSKSQTDKDKKVCVYCENDGHYVVRCDKFLALSLKDKRSFIREKNLCFGCLRKGHRNKDCQRKHVCGTCKLKHPTCLHEDRQLGTPCSNPIADSNVNTASSLRVSRQNGKGTSMIVPVWVSSKEEASREVLTYALLDTQSDTTFILDDTASALQLPVTPVKLGLSTMTSQHTVIDSSRVNGLQVRGFNSPAKDTVSINLAYTRNFIPADYSHIPKKNTVDDWPHLQPIRDEIPPLQSCEIGLLIGYNCPQALAPRKTLIGETNEPYAIETILGWSIVGYVNPKATLANQSLVSGTSCRTSIKELPSCTPQQLIKVFETDFADDKEVGERFSQEDTQFLNLMEHIKQREDKHLEMPLPFKKRPVLPDNKPLAEVRLNHLKNKFKKDPKYFAHYQKFMKEILERGDAEVVDSDIKSREDDGNIWYIPHHGVYHPKKPNKLRVVFDCSARYGDCSLNDHLLTGPDLTNALAGVLCRFRKSPIGIMCDIEKMFHQFIVDVKDRDFLRFLWWESGNIDCKPQEYRMRVHLFGAASSPGCANYGLKHLAKTQESELPIASSFIQRNFYVDDGLTSVETEDEAIQLVIDAQALCANGGLRLHKFLSNNKRVMQAVPVSERAVGVSLDLTLDPLPVERALGVQWCVESDAFKFQISVRNEVPTRRIMLSIVASVFDPLGFLSPFTLRGKQILQEMCRNGVGWDDPLPNCSQPQWEAWIKDIQNLSQVNIPRCLKPSWFGIPTVVELHHFSDASSIGYGQCSYVRLVNNTEVHCALVASKARVTPVKVVTIPRLELTAAVLSVKMSIFLKNELDLNVNNEYFWTDSRVVLGYINNEARRFQVFVANRVQMIRDATEPQQWRYIDTKDNPADHASRGLTASEIVNSTWLTGPPFLWQPNIQSDEIDTSLQPGDPEVRQAKVLHSVTTPALDVIDCLERFSSWKTAVSVVARLQRLSNGIKGTHHTSVEERENAERTIVRLVQGRAFKESMNALKASETLPRTSRLYPLDPFLQDGVIRVGGRLRNAECTMCYKHPMILPKNSHVTRLILAHVHQETKHQGRGITLNKLRSCGFWIIDGSKTVAKFIRHCAICRKLRRPTECQKMADLPKDRVEPSPPFTYCGMDCFGPFVVKMGRKEIKRYGLLLTCMCSRAIHIEMLDDMSTDAFINALRCFIAIRGSVRQIRSDQGTNFIGAKNEFEREAKVNKLSSFLVERQCDFVLNPPSASHTGGVWERQIRTVRSILNSVLSLCSGRLDDASLRTVFYEVMSIVNCRPLTVSEIDNPEALEPLTPNHILTAKSSLPQPPPGDFLKEDLYLRKRWRRVQYLLEQFWGRWRKEYLAQISLRQKWHEPRRNICGGDIVLVKDVDLPRNQWPLAKVIEAYPDDDGLVRRVKVSMGLRNTTSPSVLERSIHKLVLLVEN